MQIPGGAGPLVAAVYDGHLQSEEILGFQILFEDWRPKSRNLTPGNLSGVCVSKGLYWVEYVLTVATSMDGARLFAVQK